MGQGSAILDINWTTGNYAVSIPDRDDPQTSIIEGPISLLDGTFTFSGFIHFNNQGDITSAPTAAVRL